VWQHLAGLIFPVWCIGCGAPDIALCAACRPAPGDAVRFTLAGVPVLAAGSYGGALRESIVRLKHGERAFLAALAPVVARLVLPGSTIVPLPTTGRRRRARGFDQAGELARRAAALGGGSVCDVLRKRGGPQAGRNRRDRLARHARFELLPGARPPQAAVVFDDVCTTGATLRAGIAVLEAAGVRIDAAIVLARTPPARNQPRTRTVLDGV
jgi:predicted amidophosphoribosyltransferase